MTVMRNLNSGQIDIALPKNLVCGMQD